MSCNIQYFAVKQPVYGLSYLMSHTLVTKQFVKICLDMSICKTEEIDTAHSYQFHHSHIFDFFKSFIDMSPNPFAIH